jgi:hypothetical protein
MDPLKPLKCWSFLGDWNHPWCGVPPVLGALPTLHPLLRPTTTTGTVATNLFSGSKVIQHSMVRRILGFVPRDTIKIMMVY